VQWLEGGTRLFQIAMTVILGLSCDVVFFFLIHRPIRFKKDFDGLAVLKSRCSKWRELETPWMVCCLEWLSEPLRALLGRGDKKKVSEANPAGLVQEVSPEYSRSTFTHAL
jgi:hypothetical protein